MNADHPDAKLIALLERIALKDQAALKSLYDECAGKLYGLALRVVSQREFAEDVLQEAFLNIWRSAPDYSASLSPPMAWMGLIVRSRALDLLRRRAAERTHLTQEIDETLADTLEGDGPSPLDTAQASEQAWALNQCLGRLESKQREVVNLAYMRDLSHSELATQLQLALGHRQDLDTPRPRPAAPVHGPFCIKGRHENPPTPRTAGPLGRQLRTGHPARRGPPPF